jgi:hypothetical protein
MRMAIRLDEQGRKAMRRVVRVCLLAGGLLLLRAAASAQPAGPGTPAAGAQAAHARLELHVSPVADLHFWVRALAEGDGPVPDVPGLDAAVQAARALRGELKGSLAWGILESALDQAPSAAAVLERWSRAPETVKLGPGRNALLRPGAVRLAEALAAAEPGFLERAWPARKQALEQAVQRLELGYRPQEAAAFAFVEQHLGFPQQPVAIPVYLVLDGPFPQAFTHRRRGGGGVCFVGVRALEGSQLYEALLHEATHALDVAAGQAPTALATLRWTLRQQGVLDNDRRMRDVPHTLMFVNAAEAVRRTIDPAHRDHGDVAGYYPKVEPIAGIERAVWAEYLDGKLQREQALQRIVQQVLGR